MKSIPVGAAGSFSLVVEREHLASRFKDATLPPVLATPIMIMMMENAALNAAVTIAVVLLILWLALRWWRII